MDRDKGHVEINSESPMLMPCWQDWELRGGWDEGSFWEHRVPGGSYWQRWSLQLGRFISLKRSYFLITAEESLLEWPHAEYTACESLLMAACRQLLPKVTQGCQWAVISYSIHITNLGVFFWYLSSNFFHSFISHHPFHSMNMFLSPTMWKTP